MYASNLLLSQLMIALNQLLSKFTYCIWDLSTTFSDSILVHQFKNSVNEFKNSVNQLKYRINQLKNSVNQLNTAAIEYWSSSSF